MQKADFDKHPLHSAIDGVLRKIKGEEITDPNVQQLKTVIEYVQWVFSQSEVALLYSADLDTAHSAISPVSNYTTGQWNAAQALALSLIHI